MLTPAARRFAESARVDPSWRTLAPRELDRRCHEAAASLGVNAWDLRDAIVSALAQDTEERGRAAIDAIGAPHHTPPRGLGAGTGAVGPSRGVLGFQLARHGAAERVRPAAAIAELRALVYGELLPAGQRRVLALLRALPADALNDALAALDLGRLVHGMDEWLLGENHKEQLLSLLCRERVQELSVAARARLIGALQDGTTSRDEEQAICDVFLATRGADLSELKTRIDIGTDHHDLLELLWHDIDSERVRRAIVDHIRAASPATSGSFKVMSDIDDTFYANWLDARYPKKTVYPGVAAFYAALDRGPRDDDAMRDLLFVTARPGDRLGFMEGRAHDTLDAHGVSERAVLTGDLTGVLGNEQIARKKVDNFVRHAALFPEYGYVFIGDSGQGDALAAREMRRVYGDRLTVAFIHDVKGLSDAERAAYRQDGVVMFDTYVGAAVEAFSRGLISKASMIEVARAARRELEAIGFDTAAQQAAREAELARDLAAMNALLSLAERVG